MLLADNSKLVMIGDSITDCGRARPVGEGRGGALGDGYVRLVSAALLARQPQANIRVVNMGTSGDQVTDLARRWQQDVVDQKPDWLSVLIGINDVWRAFDCPNMPEKHVSLGTYEQTLAQLIAQTKPLVKGIVLMTPYMIEPDAKEPMRAAMGQYAEVVERIAQRHGALLVDLQAAFDRVLQYVHPYAIAWDRIHPETSGHMVIAEAFLGAIGA